MKLDNCNIQQYYIQFVKLYNIDNLKKIGEMANDLLRIEKENNLVAVEKDIQKNDQQKRENQEKREDKLIL